MTFYFKQQKIIIVFLKYVLPLYANITLLRYTKVKIVH